LVPEPNEDGGSIVVDVAHDLDLLIALFGALAGLVYAYGIDPEGTHATLAT
jgi:hypothetical protein